MKIESLRARFELLFYPTFRTVRERKRSTAENRVGIIENRLLSLFDQYAQSGGFQFSYDPYNVTGKRGLGLSFFGLVT